MAQVQKLKRGSSIQEYNQAKKQYEQAYENADSDTKAWLDGFMESSANYQVKDPMNNRSTRDHLTQIYLIGSEMATAGRSGYATPGATPRASTKNIFNGYSHEENVNNANEIARRYIKKNQQNQSSENQTISRSTATPTTASHYSYKWNDGWDSGWGFEGETISDKLSNFANLLVGNVGNMLRYKDTGYNIHGINTSKIEDYRKAHSGLTTFLNDLKEGKYNGKDIDAIKTLADLARKVGVDSTSFKEYFNDYLPKETEADKRRKALESQGFTAVKASDLGYNQDITDYLNKNKVNLMKGSDGNIYSFNDQYSDYNPLKYINMDWRLKGQENSPFNFGIFTDENGKIWTGDVTTLQAEDPYFNIMNEYRNKAKEGRSQLFRSYSNYDPNFTYTESELLKQLAKRLKNSNLYAGKPLNFVDVSQLFKSDRPIIAVNDDNSAFTEDGDDYGNLTFGDKTKFYYIGDDNQIHQVDFNQAQSLVGEYGLTGWGEEENQLGDLLNLEIEDGSTDITSDRRMSGRSWLGEMFHKNWVPGEGIKWTGFTKDIKENPQAWATVMLGILAKPASKRSENELAQLEAFDGINNPENILVFIQDLVKTDAVEVTPEMYDNWNTVMLQSYVRRGKRQHGGIIFAAKGQILDIYGNPIDVKSNTVQDRAIKADQEREDLINKAKEAGYSDTAQYKANMRKPGQTGFTATDYVRLGAIAADIASIPASFVAGYGTAVSAGLSVGSSLATLVTDIAEDGFQLRDIAGFGANLVLDVAGLFGGAGKVAKVTKQLIRYAPIAFAIWDGVTNGDKYKEVFNKLQKGKSLTVQDWKTLANGLAIVASGTRAGASSYRQRQIKNNAKLATKQPEYKLTVKKGAGTEEITLKPDEVTVLQQGDFNAANAKLKELKGAEYDLIPDKNSRLGHGWKGLFVRENSSSNPVTSKAISEVEISPDALYTINQNSIYNGLIAGNRSRYANWINRTGQKLGLASDVDMAGDNVVGRLGLLRGTKGSTSEKVPPAAPRNIVPVTPVEEAIIPTPLPSQRPRKVSPIAMEPGRTPLLAMGPRRMPLALPAHSKPIVTPYYGAAPIGLHSEVWFKNGGQLDRFGAYLKSHK